MKTLSPLQQERLKYQPKLPESLKAGINKLVCVEKEKTEAVKDKEQIKEYSQKLTVKQSLNLPLVMKKNHQALKTLV